MPAVTMAQYHTQVNDRAELAAGKKMGRKPFSFGASALERLSLVITTLSNPCYICHSDLTSLLSSDNPEKLSQN